MADSTQNLYAMSNNTTEQEFSTNYSLSGVAKLLQSASQSLEQELANKPKSELSIDDKALVNIVRSPFGAGLLHTLKHNSVNSIDIPAFDHNNPRDVLRTTLQAGNNALREHGIAPPDLQMFEKASLAANETGQSFTHELQKLQAASPALSMRTDLPVNERIDMRIADTIYANNSPAFAAPENTTSQNLAKGLGDNFQAIDYREYDVHLMAYPLKVFDLPGKTDIVSRDSHAFVVVVPKGTGTNAKELIETVRSGEGFVTRAGPDHNGLFGSSESSSGSSFGDEQPKDRKAHDGDVYVADPDTSILDLEHAHVFRIQTATISGNLEEMKDLVARHRSFINGQDINYKLVSQNSNTYAGDAFELLTQKEPKNSLSGGFGRRTPGLNNDLTDYEKHDDYAPYFD